MHKSLTEVQPEVQPSESGTQQKQEGPTGPCSASKVPIKTVAQTASTSVCTVICLVYGNLQAASSGCWQSDKHCPGSYSNKRYHCTANLLQIKGSAGEQCRAPHHQPCRRTSATLSDVCWTCTTMVAQRRSPRQRTCTSCASSCLLAGRPTRTSFSHLKCPAHVVGLQPQLRWQQHMRQFRSTASACAAQGGESP